MGGRPIPMKGSASAAGNDAILDSQLLKKSVAAFLIRERVVASRDIAASPSSSKSLSLFAKSALAVSRSVVCHGSDLYIHAYPHTYLVVVPF